MSLTDTRASEERTPVNDDLPEGMIEYGCRSAIRDLIRIHGFETGRDLVAGYLNDEADRKARRHEQ